MKTLFGCQNEIIPINRGGKSLMERSAISMTVHTLIKHREPTSEN